MKVLKRLKTEFDLLTIPPREKVINSTVFVLVASAIISTIITLESTGVSYLIEKLL